MNGVIDPAMAKLRSFAEGFFWILPNLGIAVVVLLAFIVGAWAASPRRDARWPSAATGATWARSSAASCGGS